MKLVGFIKEHDETLSSILFKEVLGINNNDPELINKILEYLSKGTLIMAWMGYFNDLETNEHVSPHGYYSDGTWLWPTYFPYYLRKYSHYNLDMNFVKYLIDKNFLIEDVIPINKAKLEEELIKKMQNG
jgi:hypothetical protein